MHRSFQGRQIQAQSPVHVVTLHIKQKSRKQEGREPCGLPSGRHLPGIRATEATASLSALLYQQSSGGPECGPGWVEAGISRNSLSGQVAPAAGLEPDDDVSDLQVPLLLQVGQHASPEEDLALADAVQVAVKLQSFDLDRGEQAVCCVSPRSPRPTPRACLSQGSG